MPLISDFHIEPFDKCLSDAHAPICVTICVPNASCSAGPGESSIAPSEEVTVSRPSQNSDLVLLKSKWDPELADQYKKAFNDADVEEFNNRLDLVNSPNLTQEDMDQLTNNLNEMCLDSAMKTGVCKPINRTIANRTGVTSAKKHNKPWFNRDCARLRADYFRVKNRLRRVKSDEVRQQLKQQASEYKKFIRNTFKTYNKNLLKKLRTLKTSQPKEYWDILNKATNNADKVGNIALQVFMDHFKKLSQKDPTEHVEEEFDPRKIDHSLNEEINRPFTFTELQSTLKKLRNNKSGGIDNMINEYLKSCPDALLLGVVKLFNLVLSSGIIPTVWCIGMIKPLYKKKGSINDPDNYRGITLLSCVGKLFTACINSRLSLYLECSGTLGEEQAGFRSGYSTIDHIFVLNSIIEIYLAKRKRIYCAFIDWEWLFAPQWGELKKQFYYSPRDNPPMKCFLTKPGMMTFLVRFMRRLIRVICFLTRVS